MGDLGVSSKAEMAAGPSLAVDVGLEAGASGSDLAMGGSAGVGLSFFELAEAGDFDLGLRAGFGAYHIGRTRTYMVEGESQHPNMDECLDPPCSGYPDTSSTYGATNEVEHEYSALAMRVSAGPEMEVAIAELGSALLTLNVSPELALGLQKEGLSNFEQGLVFSVSGGLACRMENGFSINAGARADVAGTEGLVTDQNRMIMGEVGAAYGF